MTGDRRRDESGREIIAFETEVFADGVESDEPSARYEVFPEAIVEWEWGEPGDRPWDGVA